MDLIEVARRERRQTWLAVIALAAVVALLAPPAVQAAVQQVKLKGAAKVKDSSGDNLNATNLGSLGLLEAPGSAGAMDVRTFSGGGGFLGTGDCSGSNPARPSSVTVQPKASGAPRIVTGLLITGDNASVAVSAPDLDPLIGAGPVVTFTTTAANPQTVVAFGNGLTVFPSELVFACSGSGNFVILGH